MTLAQELRAAGGHVDLERAVPEMSTKTRDGKLEVAILDVTVWFPGAVQWFPIDVTVRYAGATRYVGADRRAGTAAMRAEAEKVRRYGVGVWPLAFEQGGRLGPASQMTLARLAEAALPSCPATNARQLVLRWRRRLEAALQFAISDVILLGLGGSPHGTSSEQSLCVGHVQQDVHATPAPVQEASQGGCDLEQPSTSHEADEEASAFLHPPGESPG